MIAVFKLKSKLEHIIKVVNHLLTNSYIRSILVKKMKKDMKKILAALMLCSPIFAMDYDTRLTNVETRLTRVENNVSEIQNILNDKPDPSDPEKTVPGLVSKVTEIQNVLFDQPSPTDSKVTIPGLITKFESFYTSVVGITAGVSTLTETVTNLSKDMVEMNKTLTNLNTEFNTKMEEAWEKFVDKKFQEYMEEKKIVLDIITACKINEDPLPEYIMETAEQLQEYDLKTRRETLSEILIKLDLFERLLDGEKLESLHNYLNDTNVPEPIIKEIEELLTNAIVDRDCVKVTGATRDFTRKTALKRGIPHKSWMSPDYDYFAYKKYLYVKALINQENTRRKTQNEQNERDNALAIARYKAAIRAAERITFPAENFTELATNYNRLLTHHDI